MKRIDQATIDYRSELLRKSIHLCSLSIPIVYYFITKETALIILIPLTLFSLTIDFGRYVFEPLRNFVNSAFGVMMREHEKDEVKKNLSGATYVFVSAVACILIFPKVIVITAFAVLILGDIAAALIGRKYGTHKFLAKSLEGTTAFFIAGFVVVLFTPKVEGILPEYIIGLVAILAGGIVENISYGWADDNLTIPLSVGAVMWLLYSILLPDMSLVLPNVPN